MEPSSDATVVGAHDVAVISALPTSPTEAQPHTVGLAPLQQLSDPSSSSRVFTASSSSRPKSAGKRPTSAVSKRPVEAAKYDANSASFLQPLSSEMMDAPLLMAGQTRSTFDLSMPAWERKIPEYNSMRDPHMKYTYPAAGTGTVRDHRQALRLAAKQQRKAMLQRRERAYDKTMREAQARRAEALTEQLEHERWLPNGTWLPARMPPHVGPAPHLGPPHAASGADGAAAAVISGLARGSPRTRDAVISQIALAPSGRAPQRQPASPVQRSSARASPVAQPTYDTGYAASLNAAAVIASTAPHKKQPMAPAAGRGPGASSGAGGASGRGGALPNDSSVFGSPFVQRVVSLLEKAQGDGDARDQSVGTRRRERRVFETVASYKNPSHSSPEGVRNVPHAGKGKGGGRGGGGRGGGGRGGKRGQPMMLKSGTEDPTAEQPGWWDSQDVQSYLREKPGVGTKGVGVDELCALLDAELAALDKLLEDGGEAYMEELANAMASGDGEAPEADAITLTLAEAHETRGLLVWMRANMEIVQSIEAETPPPRASPPATEDTEEEAGLAVDVSAMATAAAEALEPEAIETAARAAAVVGSLELATTPSESGVPAVLSGMPAVSKPAGAGVDGALVPGERVLLGPLQIAAHACLAEMEQAAAADAEAFRATDFQRVAIDACRRAIGALDQQPFPAGSAEAATQAYALAGESDSLCASLRARIRTLGAACGLPATSIDPCIRDAEAAATAETDAEVAISQAVMATSKMVNAGGGGGGVVLGTHVVGAGCAQLAWLLIAIRRHAQRTRSVQMAIGQRELLVKHLRMACARLAPLHARQRLRSKLDAGSGAAASSMKTTAAVVTSLEAEIVSTVALLRQATVRVTEAVLAWRGGITFPAPFPAPLPPQRDVAEALLEEEGAEPPVPVNYVARMATDLDDITTLSAEMPGVLREAPSRLNRRRLWRARQLIDLELQTEQRAARQAAGGALMLRWKALPTSELRKVGDGVSPCLFDVAAPDDDELIQQLRAA